MAAPFPYTYYACPCSDLTSDLTPRPSKRSSVQLSTTTRGLDEERTFNPHEPRSNYALQPLEQLLYCDDCDAISCPRCWIEEVLYWYCPSCLFEVPSSAVRADGNRCSRSCYNCPSCTSPLAITALPQADDGLLKPTDSAGAAETYILHCQYCEWSSMDIDVTFGKSTKITEQLAKQRKARLTSSQARASSEEREAAVSMEHESVFASLSKFYKDQLNESGDVQNPFSTSPYNSPANLARIMSLYGGVSYSALKKTREKPQPMREAMKASEGLDIQDMDADDDWRLVDEIVSHGWDGASSHAQRMTSPGNADAKFVNQLWPIATPLRTRRGKRCKTCRQFLARPEPKVSSMRYRIRLLANSFVPLISMKPLQPPTSTAHRLFPLRNGGTSPPMLVPNEAKQYVLTVRNPVFETIQITLATPTITPGRVMSKVTILCPSFAVGPAGDVWDEVLSASQPQTTDGGRRAAMASLTGSSEPDRQPEAGKIWERTRNSTSVIVEIVPGSLDQLLTMSSKSLEGEQDRRLQEDEDVLEVPVYVRAEWEAEAKEGESSMSKKAVDMKPGEKIKKELGYWVVLGVGRIAR